MEQIGLGFQHVEEAFVGRRLLRQNGAEPPVREGAGAPACSGYDRIVVVDRMAPAKRLRAGAKDVDAGPSPGATHHILQHGPHSKDEKHAEITTVSRVMRGT